jgi:glycosyltransferase involved in cell wall biosynthesis
VTAEPDVWHLIAPAPFGGAETVVESLASSRAESGLATGAILLAPDGPLPIADRLRAAGVTVQRVSVRGRNYAEQVQRVASILTRPGVILHTHGYQGDVIGARAARRASALLVATNHGYAGGGLRNRFYEWLDRRALRRFDAVVAVSERNAEKLRAWGHPTRSLMVIPNGWRPVRVASRDTARARLGLAASEVVVGWIGRMSHEKGIDLLMAALARYNGPSLHVVCIGDGPERASAEAEAARLSVKVTFTGARSDVADVVAAFDALVISSRTEGLPMVLLEATGAGVPVVAFAVGGIPEVLTDASGWLVPPLDVEALAASLSAAASDPAPRVSRATAAHKALVQRFSASQWVAAHEALYARLRAKTK